MIITAFLPLSLMWFITLLSSPSLIYAALKKYFAKLEDRYFGRKTLSKCCFLQNIYDPQ